MTRTRQKLLDNFDDEVREKLRIREEKSRAQLNRFERLLMRLTQHELGEHAEFIDDSSFRLSANPFLDWDGHIQTGLYELPRRTGEAHLYRLNHPLASAVLNQAKNRDLPPAELQLNYAEYEGKISILEPFVGQSGWLSVSVFTVESLDYPEDHILFAAVTDIGETLDKEAGRRLMSLPARVRESAGPDEEVKRVLEGISRANEEAVQRAIAERNASRTLEVTAQQTIEIPRILVVPEGEVRTGFKEFQLDLSHVNYQPISNELWQQELRTGKLRVLALGEGSIDDLRLEDYIVAGLVDFDDVSYDDHSDLLYALATQTVQHFLSYLNEDDTRRILRVYQREIARLIHVQMQEHYWEEAVGYEVKISKGFTEIKPQRAYTHIAGEGLRDFQQAPQNKSNMSRYLFTGFQRCLYSEEKFQSDAERVLAIILDRESLKWFKPAKGQFQIYFKSGGADAEYQPDFVAETADRILMFEAKARNEMEDPEVLAKRDAAVLWGKRASDHSATYGGKPWQYVLIPHDAIAENMTLAGLADRFAVA